MQRISAWIVLAFGALALVETLALRSLDTLDHRLQDSLLRRHAQTRVADPDVILIAVDERSLDAMATEFGRWPWPRSVLAQLIERLHRYGARAVVVDIIIAEPDLGREDDDRYFVEVAQATPNAFFPLARLARADDAQGLVLAEHGEKLGFTRTAAAEPGARAALLLPFQAIAETGRIGTINALMDSDGVSRRYYVHVDVAGWRIPSLPARVVAALGYPVPEDADIEINWREGRTMHSFSDVFADLDRVRPERYAELVRDRIVVIGVSAAGLFDFGRTPLLEKHSGPEILSSAIETLKNGDALRRPPRWVDALLALAGIGLVAAIFLGGLGPLAGAAILLAATPVVVAAGYVMLGRGWIVPLVTPLTFAWVTYVARSLREYLHERARRQEAVRTFGRFVHPRMVDALLASGGGDPRHMKGQSRVVTLLFSDIRGFTTLSESRKPEEVVEILNKYFSRQVDVIFRHGGTVDKFIGDAIMAFWGAPVEDPRHAQNAVKAAIEMGCVVDAFRAELGGALATEFDIGIGVHTGPAVVGFIGSENKLDYTAIGDSVNLASRIEGATKGVARILVSEGTRQACGEDFMFADRGTFKAKGKSEEVRLFEPAERAHA